MSRYLCPECGSFVKDKFLFGLLHVCVPTLPAQPTQTYMNNLAKKYPKINAKATPQQEPSDDH